MTTIRVDSCDSETVAELMNLLCKDAFHRSLRDVKEKILKKPVNHIMSMGDVMEVMDYYGVKYELKIQFADTTVKKEKVVINDNNEGLTVGLVEKNMVSQEKEITNPEVLSSIPALPKPPEFL